MLHWTQVLVVALASGSRSWAGVNGKACMTSGVFNVSTLSDVVNMDMCQSVIGSVRITSFPPLPTLSLSSVQSITLSSAHASSSGISAPPALFFAHNLQTAQFILPQIQTLQGSLVVYDNIALTLIALPELKSISQGDILISANTVLPAWDNETAASAPTSTNDASKLNVDLSKLQSVQGNITLGDVLSLQLSNLSSVDGDFTLIQTNIDQVRLLSLQQLGGTITLQSNDQLQEIYLPQLKAIQGNFYMDSNGAFRGFNGSNIPRLQTIHGSLVYQQSKQPATLSGWDLGPSLQRIDGGFTFRARLMDPKQFSSCKDLYDRYKGSNIVRGPFSCVIMDRDGNSVDTSESPALSLIAPLPSICIAIVFNLFLHAYIL